MVSLTCKGPFIATQLNSTRRRVQLSCVVKVSIATPTQLNSTRHQVVDTFTAWTTVTDQFWTSWPSEGVYSDATQLNSARRPVELSCIGEATRQRNCSRRWVELSCVYKRALTSVQTADVQSEMYCVQSDKERSLGIERQPDRCSSLATHDAGFPRRGRLTVWFVWRCACYFTSLFRLVARFQIPSELSK